MRELEGQVPVIKADVRQTHTLEKIDRELDSMFEHVKTFQASITSDISDMCIWLGSVEQTSGNNTLSTMTEGQDERVQELERQLHELTTQRRSDGLRLRSLECVINAGSAEIEIGTDIVRSEVDVRAVLMKYNAQGAGFGAWVDAYGLLLRV